LLSLLCGAGAVFICTDDGCIAEDDSVPLRQWEFHDLFFHSRSRIGRHEYPLGGTLRFHDTLPPLPAVKPPMSEHRIALHKPDMSALEVGDIPFSRVSESRRSIRSQAAQPISAIQLGEFLYRSARVKVINPVAPEHGAHYESSLRVCSSGGAMHELELYLTIACCDGIAPGFYHYDPLDHVLEYLSDLGAAQQALLADGSGAAGLQAPPNVLITLAARFQRTSWKYQSMAYALILKDVGALYQQMYLVATAMSLAACALGAGNSDLFAEAAGLDFYAETSVGEFLLSR
jgi:SagB-type dehydrogenase family enzyme